MKHTVPIAAVFLAAATLATRSQTPTVPAATIAVVDLQTAIVSTQGGSRALADLQSKFDKQKSGLERK